MPKEFNSAQEVDNYVEKKYGVAIKAMVAKMEAVQIELARARQKFSAAPPPGLSPELVEKYKKVKAESAQIFGFCDRYLATARASAKTLTGSLKSDH